MKKIIFILCFILFALPSYGAVVLVDPATDTMTIDEGFECPYVVEVSTQEGELLTSTEMADITKVRVYFGNTEYTDSALCAACFDYSTYANSSRIVVDLGSQDWTDGTDTATLFIYDSTYTDGRRIGTFTMTSSANLASASDTPSSGLYLNDLGDVSTSGAITGQFLSKTGALTYAFATVSGGADDQTASEVSVSDTNGYTAQTTVEGWLDELDALIQAITTFPGWGDATDLDADGSVSADSVALGTDTTGQYMSDIGAIVNGGISIIASGTEPRTATIGVSSEAVANGVTYSFPTCDHVYDFCETTQDYLKTSEYSPGAVFSFATLSTTQTVNASELTGRIELKQSETVTYTFGTAQTAYELEQSPVTVIFATTSGAHFDCQATDKIIRNGTAQVDGYKVSALSPSLYDCFVLTPVKVGSDYHWQFDPVRGTYQDGGP